MFPYKILLYAVIIGCYLNSIPILYCREPQTQQKALIADEQKTFYNLGKYIEYIEDTKGALTFQDIVSGKERFTAGNTDALNFGFSDATYWIRFKISASKQERLEKDWILELSYPLLDLVEFYSADDSGGYQMIKTGDCQVFQKRDIQHHKFLFKIMTKKEQTHHYYMKIKSESSILIQLTLWTPNAFIENDSHIHLINGIYYGVLVVMIIYNFFLFISIKEINCLYFIVFMAGFLLFHMSITGYAFQYFFPNNIWWMNHSIPICTAFYGFWSTLFCKTFLQTHKYQPRTDKVLNVCAFIIILLFMYSFIGSYVTSLKLCLAFAFIVSVIYLFSSGYAYFNKQSRSNFFFLGWVIFSLGGIMKVLLTFGMLPYTMLTNHCVEIGAALNSIFLSMSISDDINKQKIASSVAQQEALDAQHQINLDMQQAYKDQEEIAYQVEQKAQDLLIVSDHLSQNANLMKQMLDTVNQTSEGMIHNINVIAPSVKQLSVSVNNISRTSTQVAQNIHAVSSEIDNLSGSMTDINENVQKEVDISQQGVQMTENASNAMNALTTSAENIDHVSALIKRIADKTNLLALNAAIEAAAAGEFGKGFAVVSNSIQKFADQSADAAETITRQVIDVQSNSNKTVKVLGELLDIINQISFLSDIIIKKVVNQQSNVSEIADNCSEANERSKKIADTMNELSKAAVNISKNTDEMNISSDDVAKHIDNLSDAVLQSINNIGKINLFSNELSQLAKNQFEKIKEKKFLES